MEKTKDKTPLRFFAITFLWSWLFWGLGIFLGRENPLNIENAAPGIGFISLLLGSFGPAVGAIISLYTIDGKDAVKKYLKSFFSLNFGLKVWLSIFLVLGLAGFIAWILPEFFGEDRLPSYLPGVYIFPLYLLIMIFFGGGQEEIGWRGYISPYLEKRFGLILGALILGIIWAIWHIPLWFLPGASQSYMNFFGFTLLTIGYSYFFSWIIEASGHRPMSGLIAHGTANAFAALLPFLVMAHNSRQTRFWIYPVIILIIGIIVVIVRTNKNRRSHE